MNQLKKITCIILILILIIIAILFILKKNMNITPAQTRENLSEQEVDVVEEIDSKEKESGTYLLFDVSVRTGEAMMRDVEEWGGSQQKLYSDGEVISYDIYNIAGKQNIKRYKLSEDEMKELIDILNTDFYNYSTGSFTTMDGADYVMTYYNEEGTALHYYKGDYGDIQRSDTLSKILKIINR